MTKTDFTQRFVFEHMDARGCFVRLQQSLQDIHATHHYPQALRGLLNQFSLAAVLLRDSIKIDASVTIQLRTPGPLKLVMADCMTDRKLRAIAEYDAEELAASDSLVLSDMGESATLAITISPEEGDRYQSIVPIESRSLQECLEDYFSRSEQLPTWFTFLGDEELGIGISIHALPSEKIVDEAENLERFSALKHYLSTLSEEEALQLTSEEILSRLFNEEPCRVFSSNEVVFGCDCSVNKSIEAIYTLGKEDVEMLILEQQAEGNESLIVDCHFCFQRYEFDFAELGSLFD